MRRSVIDSREKDEFLVAAAYVRQIYIRVYESISFHLGQRPEGDDVLYEIPSNCLFIHPSIGSYIRSQFSLFHPAM